MYENIITHNDFDGVVSAALCSFAWKLETIYFTGPSSISRAEVSISDRDIVCDLPYPLECGLWFDHHEGNRDELAYRNINPETIPGRFRLEPSCARVIYQYLLDQNLRMPDFFSRLVNETDIIDSFNYTSIEGWRQETPGKIIDNSIKVRHDSSKEKNQYLRQLVFWLRDEPYENVAQKPLVQELFEKYAVEEQDMLRIIGQSCYFTDSDVNHEIIVIDLTHYNRRPHIIRNLAFLLHAQALAVVEIGNIFERGVKTNNLTVSMSLSLNLNHAGHGKSIGEIMRQLNIGDGHAGAAAGTLFCNSKQDMLKQKQMLIENIFRIWSTQS
ncbi:hypothetical protein JW960_15025 [candidate division KSB1 bacterium]|nr:hypothetical protein [candidate division KSB1 bacterium]